MYSFAREEIRRPSTASAGQRAFRAARDGGRKDLARIADRVPAVVHGSADGRAVPRRLTGAGGGGRMHREVPVAVDGVVGDRVSGGRAGPGPARCRPGSVTTGPGRAAL